MPKSKDSSATNFDGSAKKDDNSCTYKGQVVFWYDKSVSDTSAVRGTTTFTYYVDNTIVGSSAANVYFTGAPTCGQTCAITVDKELGTNKSNSYSYKVVDQAGNQVWSGTQEFTANACVAAQLKY